MVWSYWTKIDGDWRLVIERDIARIDAILRSSAPVAAMAEWDSLSADQIAALEQGINPLQLGPLNYYPLDSI